MVRVNRTIGQIDSVILLLEFPARQNARHEKIVTELTNRFVQAGAREAKSVLVKSKSAGTFLWHSAAPVHLVNASKIRDTALARTRIVLRP